MLIDVLDKKEFNKVSHFYKKYPAYGKLLDKLSDCDKIKDKYFPGRKILIQLTKEECLKEAQKYSGRSKMQKNSRPHYRRLKKYWPEELDKLFN